MSIGSRRYQGYCAFEQDLFDKCLTGFGDFIYADLRSRSDANAAPLSTQENASTGLTSYGVTLLGIRVQYL